MNRYLFLKYISLIALLSFLFNFVWEWFQCVPFFVHRGTQASPITMVMAAFGDVGLTLIVLVLVYIVTSRRQPLIQFMQTTLQRRKFALVEIMAFLVAVTVEKLALATNRWSYTDINPIIPGVGVSFLPVLQLMLLIPLVLLLTLSVLRRSSK